MRALPVLLLAAFVRSAAAAAPPPLAVALDVRETVGVARQAFPARASVPLPRGQVTTEGALWLAAPGGKAAVAQMRALEYWSDRSIRWLLIDFLADVSAGGHATYTLRAGKPAVAAAVSRLKSSQLDDSHVVDTGPIRVTVATVPGSALVDISSRHGGAPTTISLPALVIEGQPDGTPVPGPTSIETEGPVYTQFLLTGRYPSGITYEARLGVFAGQPLVRVQLTLTSLSDRPYLPVRALQISVPGRFTSTTFGVDGRLETRASLEHALELLHSDALPARLNGERVGQHADGWALARGDGRTALLVVPDFWQQYPKAFRIDQNHLTVDLFAAREQPVAFGMGAAKTHEFWIVYSDDLSPARGAALATALAAPLEALPGPSWIVSSGALPNALAPDTPVARDFLARLSTSYGQYTRRATTERWDDGPAIACERRTVEHPRVGLYGLFNWGDWQFPGYRDHNRGCDGWGNLEYDLTQVLGLAYAATGSRTFYDGLVPAARHYRDVDVIHHWTDHPAWVGMNHPHKPLHFAVEAKEKVDLGHVWAEGLVTFYRLSGEVRALQAAIALADAIAPGATHAHNPRQYGWPMLALAAVFDATRMPRHLDAARAYAAAAMESFRPTPAAGDWKMGILADGLAAVHAATGDDRIRRWLVAYADELVADQGQYSDPRYALPLGYLAALTSDQRYAGRALTTVRALKLGGWGKPLAAMGRTGFRLLSPLAHARFEATVPAPAAPSTTRPAPRARTPGEAPPPFFEGPPPTFAPRPGRVASPPPSPRAAPPR